MIQRIICKVQNLLPDTCQICNCTYVSKISDSPLLACELCGQEVHKKCFLAKIGVTPLDNCDVFKIINPLQLPGIHYFCQECEKEVVPLARNINDLAVTGTEPQSNIKEANDFGPLASEVISTCQGNSVSSKAVNHPPTVENHASTVQNGEINTNSSATISKKETCNSKTEIFNNNTPPAKSKEANNKTKNCVFYLKNRCKHGLKGTKCAFLHPERCTKLLQHGTKSPEGCNLGKKCSFFHPKMCPSSITKRVCFDEKCQFVHVKGTKRMEQGGKTLKKSQAHVVPNKPVLIDSRSDKSSTDLTHPPPIFSKVCNGVNSNLPSTDVMHSSNASFLDVISLLKKELCEAMDIKIARSLAQVQPHYPPVQHNPPFVPNLMRQTFPTFPFQPQLPQFPPMLHHH